MKFIKRGTKVDLLDSGFTTQEELDNIVYEVKYDAKNNNYFLRERKSFIIPEVLYGNLHEEADFYLNSFEKLGADNLGILLLGYKGSGKSLLAKIISAKADMPTLIIPYGYSGDEFASFLNDIEQDCIVFVDEFEKLYHPYSKTAGATQEELLSVLDGLNVGRKIWLFTANDPDLINDKLNNRTKRIRYRKSFDGLSEEVINHVIDVRLEHSSYKEDILTLCKIIGRMNMDVLTAIIDETNIHNNSPRELIKRMNISPDATEYRIETTVESKKVNMSLVKEGKEFSTLSTSYKSNVLSNLYDLSIMLKDDAYNRVYIDTSDYPSDKINFSVDSEGVVTITIDKHESFDSYTLICTPKKINKFTF